MTGTSGLRVLIVDDDANELFVCAKLLERHCEVVTATTPAQAPDRLRSEHFDVVLSDQILRDMLGTQLLAAVRRLQPATRRILTSAFVETADVLPAIHAGDVHLCVGKPVNPQELFDGLAPARLERVRCAVIDGNETRARGIADILAGETSLEAACVRSIDGGALDGIELDLAILVEPGSVRVAEQMIETLRRRARKPAVMVALPGDAGIDGAGFLG